MRRRHGINRLRYQAAGRRGWSARTLAQSLLDELTGGVKNSGVPQALRHDPVAAAELRAAVSKAAGSLFECEVRYAVAAPRECASGSAARAAMRARLRGVADCLAGAFAVHAERNWWARKPLRAPRRALAGRHLRHGDLLSVAELAACARLPLDARAFGVTRAGARSVAPAPGVPDPSSGTGVRLLGDADAGPSRAVGVSIADGRRHTHLLGATGSGKSTLMGRMILDDVAARRGVVVIDPKGDLIADVLARLPEGAGRRTVLIDPTEPDQQAWPSLNVLATGDDRQLLVDNLVGIFRRIYAASWGPRTDDLLRSSCLTLLATAEASTFTVTAPTLTDVLELLTSDAHRREVTARLGRDQQVLRTFWANYAALTDAGRVAVCAPLLNKLRAFLLRDFARATVAAPVSTIDMTRVLNGGILLVRLPKGALGEETARLLGSFIVAATWQAASQRAKTDEAARIDASLYVDEAANFLNLPYPLEDMLAEARAYRLSMTLAHQNLAQLTSELREGISANTRNKVFFACSPEDARTLATHVAPNLTEHDLAHLGAFQAAVRPCISGVPSPAFTMRTRPLPDHVTGRAEQIRADARAALAKRRKALTSQAAQIPAPAAPADLFRIRT